MHRGLAAAFELANARIPVTLLEQDDRIGGLAGSFDVGGVSLERLYHYWFASNVHVIQLIEELGLQDHLVLRETRTGMYFADRFFRLSDPARRV